MSDFIEQAELELIDTSKAAEILKCGTENVRKFIRNNKLKARQIGGIYIIDPDDLQRLATRLKKLREKRSLNTDT